MSATLCPSRIRASLVLAALLAAAAAVAAPSARLFRAPAYRVLSIEPPAGWELSASPPSPRLLATWTHRDGARLTLVAAPAQGSAAVLYEQSRPSLEKQGWVIRHVDKQPTRVLVDAAVERGKRVARQLYLVADGYAYVLTISSPSDQAEPRGRDFDETIAGFRTGAAP